jgi:hypothetical protein
MLQIANHASPGAVVDGPDVVSLSPSEQARAKPALLCLNPQLKSWFSADVACDTFAIIALAFFPFFEDPGINSVVVPITRFLLLIASVTRHCATKPPTP